jgi:hypothetical protein
MVKKSMKKRRLPQKRNLSRKSVPSVAKAGEVQQHLVIFIIAVVAIVGLVAFLFLIDVDQFAGQAIKITSDVPPNAAGIFLDESTAVPGKEVTLPIKANIGNKESVALTFTLAIDGVKCDVSMFNLKLPWSKEGFVEQTGGCNADNSLWVSLGTINPNDALKKTFDVGEITFTMPPTGKITSDKAEFHFTEFKVLELGTTTNLITKNQGVDILKEASKITCTDTDKGKTYGVAGSVTNLAAPGTSPTQDTCQDGKLTEMFCTADGKVDFETHTCATGTVCKDGACVKPGITCTDSDKGKTYDVAGSVTNLAAPGTSPTHDTCQDGKLTEMFCTADGKVDFETHTCATGTVCKGGACLKPVSTDELSIVVSNPTTVFKVNTDKASEGETLTINVKAKPKVALPKDHLLIVQVTYGTSTKSVVYETKGLLAKDTEETFQFTHEVLSNQTGDLKIKAFIWGNWPNAGKGSSLVTAKAVEYEIK